MPYGPLVFQVCSVLLTFGFGVREESGVIVKDTLFFLYAKCYDWLTDDPLFLCGALCSYYNLVFYVCLVW